MQGRPFRPRRTDLGSLTASSPGLRTDQMWDRLEMTATLEEPTLAPSSWEESPASPPVARHPGDEEELEEDLDADEDDDLDDDLEDEEDDLDEEFDDEEDDLDDELDDEIDDIEVDDEEDLDDDDDLEEEEEEIEDL